MATFATMKRLLIIFVAIVYFCTSSGFVMSVHYCMGKVSKVKMELLPKKMCGCGKLETKGCCKTESKFIKLNDNHHASYADFHIAAPVHIVPTVYTINNTVVYKATQALYFNNHSPPIYPSQPIYLLNCVFRI